MSILKEKTDVFSERIQTEEAISLVKTAFEAHLSKSLDLKKISAPMIVLQGTGINDDLSGTERPVSFPIKAMSEYPAEVVQSLAKWKRLRLKEYQIPHGKGILTDMRALRPDEEFSPIHSMYVDQWDWELCLPPRDRDLAYLKQTVRKIYQAILFVEKDVFESYPERIPILPPEVTFLHSEELLKRYPGLDPKERENRAARDHGAVFIIGIGGLLSNGQAHDNRAPDYDDWTTESAPGHKGLNGDLIFWNSILERAFEVSSMGIRVDKEALQQQLELTGQLHRRELHYHQQLLRDAVPQSIGGGIGQSRLCMFLLRKSHIGEVQVSIWPENLKNNCEEQGIHLL